MATVCIAFFLITQFYCNKMDADPEEREISRKQKRWSMNSQRLEQIVAELMKPISDIRRNFDTDLSALLEEYLTEAGLHALEASEADEPGPAGEVAPNFAEIALLLQQSAHIYSRKVDCLYQDVLRVTDALNNSTLEDNPEEGEADVSGGSTSKRKVAAAVEAFEPIRLETASSARREGTVRPPPTLPRLYIELEPRPLAPADTQLTDYASEPIGLLADFHVAWRLSGGFLLEELEERASLLPPPSAPPPSEPPPLTLPQLSLPPPPPSPLLPPSPFNCSTPLPSSIKRERKRRIDVTQDLDPGAKLIISEEVLTALRGEDIEFSVPSGWIQRVVARRSGQLLATRLRVRAKASPPLFRGWDNAAADVGGFCGWPEEAARSALNMTLGELRRVRLLVPDESDDDGFFEQSSSSDGEPRRSPDPSASDWQKWREGILARATSHAPDVRQTAALVLRSAPAAPAPPAPFTALLRHHYGAHATKPSHLMLAALFLANSGNIEIIQGEPLSINSFSVRVISRDESLYQPALARDAPS
ncbi:uncharacterized protein LOC125052559 isoform X1 [Pieris napi]|uniref:uncharacterized protein LOC125052559 isoform X1 n=2 Tax=Pieris napi TaxID=78633 RepID=UPI001FBA5653|nr:uncharacterized protein LOC125052559 isoform X1 [Pieris napi]